MKRPLACLLAIAALGAAEPPPVAPTPTPAHAATPRLFLGLTLEEVAATVDAPPALRVGDVTPGGTAERIGLRAGDVLLRVGDAEVRTTDAFRAAIAGLQPGAALRVAVQRADATVELSGTVEPPPRPRDVLTDADRLRGEAAALRADVERERVRTRLEELLALARELERGLPEAAAEFKKLYPDGSFSIQLKIDIRSDARAPAPEALQPAKPAAEKPAEETPAVEPPAR